MAFERFNRIQPWLLFRKSRWVNTYPVWSILTIIVTVFRIAALTLNIMYGRDLYRIGRIIFLADTVTLQLHALFQCLGGLDKLYFIRSFSWIMHAIIFGVFKRHHPLEFISLITMTIGWACLVLANLNFIISFREIYAKFEFKGSASITRQLKMAGIVYSCYACFFVMALIFPQIAPHAVPKNLCTILYALSRAFFKAGFFGFELQKFFILSVHKQGIFVIFLRKTKAYEKFVMFGMIPFAFTCTFMNVWLRYHNNKAYANYFMDALRMVWLPCGFWTLLYSIEKFEDFKFECIDHADFEQVRCGQDVEDFQHENSMLRYCFGDLKRVRIAYADPWYDSQSPRLSERTDSRMGFDWRA